MGHFSAISKRRALVTQSRRKTTTTSSSTSSSSHRHPSTTSTAVNGSCFGYDMFPSTNSLVDRDQLLKILCATLLLSLSVLVLYRSGAASAVSGGSGGSGVDGWFLFSSFHDAPLRAVFKYKQQQQQQQQQQQKQHSQQAIRPHQPTATIAYAISLVKCGDKQSTPAGLLDAALVLRHSVHLQSYRMYETSRSAYDYNMYAIVHRDAVPCSDALQQAGFTIVVRDPPIVPTEIKGEFLSKNIHKEWCCGHDEFIKLYAYELPGTDNNIPEPIVVHVDIDFAFYRPMDHLYDAMLFDKDSVRGKAARSMIQLERPDDNLPDRIDAYVTRDYPQLIPGRIPGYQAGFLIAKRDTAIVPDVVQVIREGNYTDSWGRDNGWGGKGYGGYVGAMAMQGLMAYFYDHVRPNTAVELNSCRYNHMGMDNLYRAHPNFMPVKYKSDVGKCRSQRPDCEDCTLTNTSLIYNVHYTQCRKPWNCISQGTAGGSIKYTDGRLKTVTIDTNCGKLDHCLELVKMWHTMRTDLETNLFALTNDTSIFSEGQSGTYKTELFQGHCTAEEGGGYQQLSGSSEAFRQVPVLYGKAANPQNNGGLR